jgi:hypothetical protein
MPHASCRWSRGRCLCGGEQLLPLLRAPNGQGGGVQGCRAFVQELAGDNRRVIRFRFELRPLADVGPWGGSEGPATLHWFGLTEGWYWIEVDGLQLLRYDRGTLDRLGVAGEPAVRPYADYFVARFWEDLLLVHRAALEPVPDDLESFLRWHPEEWPVVDDSDAGAAEEWLWAHDLDQGHLINAPALRLWTCRDGERLTLTWRHGHAPGPRFDAPDAGEVVVPAAAFSAAVADLHDGLLAAMDARIGDLEREGAPEGVDIDLVGLRDEQNDRGRWLRLGSEAFIPSDWARIRRGAGLLLDAPS